MVDTFEARLRGELQSLRGAPVDGDRLVAAGHRRARRRRARTVAVSAASCLAVVAGTATLATLAGDGPGESGLTPTLQPAEDGPSQTPEDARRDGVHPAVAALPLAERMDDGSRAGDRQGMPEGGGIAEAASEEGTWAVSEPVPDAFGEDGCTPDRPDADPVCVGGYSEVLLLDGDGRIAQAYPLPGLAAGWVHVTDDHVYAGAMGDGGLPDSALVRIDRATGAATVVVLPDEGPSGELPARSDPPGWLVATPAVAAEAESLVATGPGAAGTPVASRFGDTSVDLAGVDELIDAMSGNG